MPGEVLMVQVDPDNADKAMRRKSVGALAADERKSKSENIVSAMKVDEGLWKEQGATSMGRFVADNYDVSRLSWHEWRQFALASCDESLPSGGWRHSRKMHFQACRPWGGGELATIEWRPLTTMQMEVQYQGDESASEM